MILSLPLIYALNSQCAIGYPDNEFMFYINALSRFDSNLITLQDGLSYSFKSSNSEFLSLYKDLKEKEIGANVGLMQLPINDVKEGQLFDHCFNLRAGFTLINQCKNLQNNVSFVDSNEVLKCYFKENNINDIFHKKTPIDEITVTDQVSEPEPLKQESQPTQDKSDPKQPWDVFLEIK